MTEFDVAWNVGVPGWRVDGRHVTLAEALAAADPAQHDDMRRRHQEACVLLELALRKLRGELVG